MANRITEKDCQLEVNEIIDLVRRYPYHIEKGSVVNGQPHRFVRMDGERRIEIFKAKGWKPFHDKLVGYKLGLQDHRLLGQR